MSNRIYAYLRASTSEQDAQRSKQELQSFAEELGQNVCHWFSENESGATLERPELFRLLDIAASGDVLLVEQVDRISRLNKADWERLRGIINEKKIRLVALDLPTSHQQLKVIGDEFTERMLDAVNNMMLDMLAAISRKDYEDRRRRQKQGIAKAKLEGKYKGRPINLALHENISNLLSDGKSYTYIQKILGCSRHTISKVKKQELNSSD
ncbi:recombinase family protein [Thalassotalea maritima]|uniref:recombinase family protein n=1 Tax=Thalassotalea maritima TaxID=3242416 RepID=UPI003528C717